MAEQQRAKSKTVLGKKNPDKITQEKYRKIQNNLQEKVDLLDDEDEVDKEDEDDKEDDIESNSLENHVEIEHDQTVPQTGSEACNANEAVIPWHDSIEETIATKNSQKTSKKTENYVACDSCNKMCKEGVGLSVHKKRWCVNKKT